MTDYFSQFGEVEEARNLRRSDERPSGTFFVLFKSQDDANSAKEANGRIFHDRVMNCNIAKRRTQQGGFREQREDTSGGFF